MTHSTVLNQEEQEETIATGILEVNNASPNGYSLSYIEYMVQKEKIKKIGHFNNKWRQRQVDIYSHPNSPKKIVTVGFSYDRKQVIICEELAEEWQKWIGNFNGVYE